MDGVLMDKFTLTPSGAFARLAAMDFVELQGVVVQLIAKHGEIKGSLDVEVVS